MALSLRKGKKRGARESTCAYTHLSKADSKHLFESEYAVALAHPSQLLHQQCGPDALLRCLQLTDEHRFADNMLIG